MANHAKAKIRIITEKFIAWCGDTSPEARLERTIAQGIIGVIAATIAGIADAVPPYVQLLIVPLVMAVLAPIQAQIADSDKGGE